MTQGYVYVLTNPAMPGMVKIGRTTRDPVDRAKELRSTGVPTHFELFHASFVEDCEASERQIHTILAERGVRTVNDREFFEISPPDAVALIETLAALRIGAKPNFIQAPVLAEAVQALAIPTGPISIDQANYLARRLTQIGRQGCPYALKRCAEIFLVNCPTTIQYREYSLEYLTLAMEEAIWSRLDGSNGRERLNQLGREAFEYLENLFRNRWLLDIDCSFISEFLVSGNQFIYEGYAEELSRTKLPREFVSRVENL